jgi:hypothetical protein
MVVFVLESYKIKKQKMSNKESQPGATPFVTSEYLSHAPELSDAEKQRWDMNVITGKAMDMLSYGDALKEAKYDYAKGTESEDGLTHTDEAVYRVMQGEAGTFKFGITRRVSKEALGSDTAGQVSVEIAADGSLVRTEGYTITENGREDVQLDEADAIKIAAEALSVVQAVNNEKDRREREEFEKSEALNYARNNAEQQDKRAA